MTKLDQRRVNVAKARAKRKVEWGAHRNSIAAQWNRSVIEMGPLVGAKHLERMEAKFMELLDKYDWRKFQP